MKKMIALAGLLFSLAIFASASVKRVYTIDPAQSKLKWTGRKIGGMHWGHVRLQQGQLEFQDANFVGGSFVVDMSSLDVQDIKKASSNKDLVDHLKSADFFNTTEHKTAQLKITKVTPTGKGGVFDVEADLTIKGTSKGVKFQMTVSPSEGGIRGVSNLKFNRTHYGIKYKSSSFFKNLGDKVIYDDVEVAAELVATKK